MKETTRLRSLVALFLLTALAVAASCSSRPERTDASAPGATAATSSSEELRFAGEKRLRNLRQLTFGGENAEAYFSGDGTELIFQSTRDEFECDQIFRMDVDGKNQRLVSTGVGRTTCAFIFPDQPKILYSSSHATLKTCPPKPDYSRGYVWPLLPDFEIYVAGPNGENPTPLAPHPGYDAEAVVSPQGDGIVFTSTRSGDVDIWFMKPDGTGLKQLTTEVGYDGGAFFSRDGQKIVYRAHHPKDPEALEDYKALLADNLVRPSVMNLMVMDRDGSNKREILANGAANFAPYWHPDGERIIFASNMDAEGGRNFDLYMINADGSGLERITFNPSFDAFPMFSYDGTKLVFASNRNNDGDDTNVFVADWVDEVEGGPETALEGAARIEATSWQERAEALSDESMQGRGLGTPGLEKAAAYLAEQFEAIGLKPAGDAGSYLQKFPATVSASTKAASLKVADREAALDTDFRPFPFSASGDAKAEAIFVGYGITSAEKKYDDYAGVDVQDKIAVAFRYEPRRDDPKSRFDGKLPSRASDLRFKALNARHHGAAALIVINPPASWEPSEKAPDAKSDTLYSFEGAPSEVGIPVVHLTWAGAQKLFDARILREAGAAIDASEAPQSRALGVEAAVSVAIERHTADVANVVGRLGPETGKALVIGAHYDHLGHGGEGSLAPESSAIHYGADDNASGVAAVLELAEAFKTIALERPVYFVAFTAEESGLLGSHHFVQNPPVPIEDIAAMLNFDMIGRLRDGNLTVLGAGTAKSFVETLRRAQIGLPLDLELGRDGFGPSDQMAFYVKGVPVLHFFTGVHEDYHTPGDTADKLNAEGAELVTTFAFRVAEELATTKADPVYVQLRSQAAGDSGHDGRRGYGPYFGSIPAFGASDVKGVRLEGARSGSPADKAGIKKGDVLVKFGEFEVTTLQDYAYALRQHKPGDSVELVVVRDGEEVTLQATLGSRKDRPAGKGNPHGHGHGQEPGEKPSTQPSNPHH